MTAEETQSNTPSDNAQPVGDTPALPDAPALNREQRRAQAKGKKGTTPGFHPANATNMRGGGRPANAPIQNKIPRTGHK